VTLTVWLECGEPTFSHNTSRWACHDTLPALQPWQLHQAWAARVLLTFLSAHSNTHKHKHTRICCCWQVPGVCAHSCNRSHKKRGRGRPPGSKNESDKAFSTCQQPSSAPPLAHERKARKKSKPVLFQKSQYSDTGDSHISSLQVMPQMLRQRRARADSSIGMRAALTQTARTLGKMFTHLQTKRHKRVVLRPVSPAFLCLFIVHYLAMKSKLVCKKQLPENIYL